MKVNEIRRINYSIDEKVQKLSNFDENYEVGPFEELDLNGSLSKVELSDSFCFFFKSETF